MDIERSLEVLSTADLNDLYLGSLDRLSKYYIEGKGKKWENLYNIEKPVAVALCQGAAIALS